MTNEQIQLVGISEESFAHASEEQRIEWAKANTTAGVGLCKSAFEWLQPKTKHQGVLTLHEFTRETIGSVCCDRSMSIFRLVPDYQPPVNPRMVFGWVEYEVAPVNGVYCVRLGNGSTWRLDKASNRVGFGGVRFDRGKKNDRWFMTTRYLTNGDGLHESGMDYESELEPAVPVICRFWEAVKDSGK